MRRQILDFVRRLAGTTGLREDLAALRPIAEQAQGRCDFRIPDWWSQSFWEPTVALAIRDHVRPGDVVYDVGTNAGALAMQMSRLAGPRGTVCAFEASTRIIPRTQYNLVQAGCFNTTLFHRAVWHTTGSVVNIAPGSHLNDRIEENTPGTMVSTIALDDFALATGLNPSFIKMDIEGAEFDALRGMPRLLREGRPILVLEQSPSDMRCHTLLVECGYSVVDLATYKEIHTAADFPQPSGVANVLCVPNELVSSSPYFGIDEQLIASIKGDQFKLSPDGSVSLPDPVPLTTGRYIVRADFSAEGRDNEVFAGVEADGEVIFRYHTYTAFLEDSYRDWVIQLDRPAKIAPYLRFLNGTDPSLVWRGSQIFHLPAFDGRSPPVIT